MDEELSLEQRQKIDALTNEDLVRIDAAISDELKPEWRKASQVVGFAMMSLRPCFKGIPDVFFGRRLRLMGDMGVVEVRGSFVSLRTTEVRRLYQK